MCKDTETNQEPVNVSFRAETKLDQLKGYQSYLINQLSKTQKQIAMVEKNSIVEEYFKLENQ